MKNVKRIFLASLLAVSTSKAMFVDLRQQSTYAPDVARQVVSCTDGCIEPYQAARDFAVVSAIVKEYPHFLMHHQTQERLFAILANHNVPTMAVYRVSGVTVGFVNVVVAERNFLWFTTRYTVIAGIGVATRYQGKGYGNVLLEYAIAASREARVAQMELEVHQNNRKALAWYQSKGFKIESQGADGWIKCVLPLVAGKL